MNSFQEQMEYKKFMKGIKTLRSGDRNAKFNELYELLDIPELLPENLKKVPIPILIEAMIISAAKKHYGNNLNIQGETALMSLGLLDGFYHYECIVNTEKRAKITRCRIKFLKESSYLRDDYSESYNTYEEAVENDGEKKIIEALKAAEVRYINKIFETLFDKTYIIYQEVNQNSIEYFHTYRDDNGKTEFRLTLPPMQKSQNNRQYGLKNTTALNEINAKIDEEINIILNGNGTYVDNQGFSKNINPYDIDSLFDAFNCIVKQLSINTEDTELQIKAGAVCNVLMTKGDDGRGIIKYVLDDQVFDNDGNCIQVRNIAIKSIVERIVQNKQWMDRTKAMNAGFFRQLNDIAASGRASRSQIEYIAIAIYKTSPIDMPRLGDMMMEVHNSICDPYITYDVRNIYDITEFERRGVADALHIIAQNFTKALTNEGIANSFRLKNIYFINRIRQASYYAKVRKWACENECYDLKNALIRYEKQYGEFQYLNPGDKLKVPPPKGFSKTGIWVGASMGMGDTPNSVQQNAFDEWQKESAKIDAENKCRRFNHLLV